MECQCQEFWRSSGGFQKGSYLKEGDYRHGFNGRA